ncbi:MAG TPA: DUF4112 domain-containing protein [Acidobacteriaceae bacterium]|jgi:hypothetical protein
MAVNVSNPEVLRPGQMPKGSIHPRFNRATGVFSDENLDMLSRLLDTWFRIPGTKIRFGVDGIVGFVPVVGDILTGLASCIIVLAAFVRGVPLVTIARMVVNLVVEVAVGTVPVVGNLFDIGWRANRRNYHLLERSLTYGRRDTWKDWIFMGLLGAGLMALAMIPCLLLLWLGGALLHGVKAPGW